MKKLLLVTENLNVGFVAVRFLNRRGFEVTTAADVDSAVAWFGDLQPDIVLIDDIDRGRGSLEILRRLRDLGEVGAMVPVLMAGSIDWDSMIELEAKALGVHRFLFEPFDDFLRLQDVLVQTMMSPRPELSPKPSPPASPTPSRLRYPTTPRPQRTRARVARSARVEEPPAGGGPSPSPRSSPPRSPSPRAPSSEGSGAGARPRGSSFLREGDVLRFRPQSVELGESLSERSVAELFLCAHTESWTGALALRRGGAERTFFFKSGALVHISSTDVQDSLAGHLRRVGAITDEQLRELDAERQRTGRSQAELLIQRGLISPHEVFEKIAGHMSELALDSLSWAEGRYDVRRGESPAADAVPLRLELLRLVVDGCKRHLDRDRVRALIPLDEGAFVVLREGGAIPRDALKLSTMESRIFDLARDGLPLQELSKGGCCSEREAYGFLFALLIMSMVELSAKGPARPVATPGPGPDRRALAEKLARKPQTTPAAGLSTAKKKYSPAELELIEELGKLEKVNYFQILGIERGAENAEVQRAFRVCVKKYHPDKMARSLPEIRDKGARVYHRIVTARQVLSDENERRIYEATLDSDSEGGGAPALPPESPREEWPKTPNPVMSCAKESFVSAAPVSRYTDDPYQRAEESLKAGCAAEAVAILEAAKKEQGANIRLNAWLGWALYNVDPKKNRREAEQLLTKAHEANPHHPDPVILRARLAAREESYNLAFDLYFRARELSPRDEALKSELAAFEKRFAKVKPRKREKSAKSSSSEGGEGRLFDKDVGDIFKSLFKK